jgi:transcriptional regulator of acetoin/glycerol metabolism
MPRVNWLLIGGNGAIGSLLEMVPLDSLILTWRPREPLALPSSPRGGTVLLHDVDRLTTDDQQQLLEWLERPARRARIVSTTSTHLLPRVRAGAFIETLYYNLNTICVDVTA